MGNPRTFKFPHGVEGEINDYPGLSALAEKEGWEEIESPSGPKASEAVWSLANENGIDLSALEGTGKGGAILKKDVEAAIEAAKGSE